MWLLQACKHFWSALLGKLKRYSRRQPARPLNGNDALERFLQEFRSRSAVAEEQQSAKKHTF